MPPFSGKAAESSAATREVGIKKKMAAKTKKKGVALPKRAAAGRFLMLSMAAMMRIIKEKDEIFFDIEDARF